MRVLKPLERVTENAVVQYARKRGIAKECIVKLNGVGKRSHPDRMFLHGGRTLFIEFKRKGEKPTPLQRHLHRIWGKHGFKVHVVDNVYEGFLLVDMLIKPKRGRR